MGAVLMTGGHSGLGLVGARTLALRYGCDLVLAGRDRERVENGAKRLRAETKVKVDVVTLDLNSLASVRQGATTCKALLRAASPNTTKLGAIICNAGVQMTGPVAFNVDGYEQTFASNCLGHFLLVNLLLDWVIDRGRIIWTASGTHDPQSMDGKAVGKAVEPNAIALARLGRSGKPISGGRRYATSKLCTVMYAYELDRRMRQAAASIVSIAYDPGFLPDMGLGLKAPAVFRSSVAKFLLRKLGMTIGQMPLSGEALGMLSEDKGYELSSGRYFHSKNGVLGEARSSSMSYNVEKAAKLWVDSEILVNLERCERPAILG